MDVFKRIVAAVVILTFLCLPFPKMIHAKQSYWLAQETEPTKITQNAPEYLATPEQQMPLEEEKSYFKAILAVLGGVILVGGLAAMAGGGGGGGGGGGNGGDDGGGTGSVSVGW